LSRRMLAVAQHAVRVRGLAFRARSRALGVTRKAGRAGITDEGLAIAARKEGSSGQFERWADPGQDPGGERAAHRIPVCLMPSASPCRVRGEGEGARGVRRPVRPARFPRMPPRTEHRRIAGAAARRTRRPTSAAVVGARPNISTPRFRRPGPAADAGRVRARRSSPAAKARYLEPCPSPPENGPRSALMKPGEVSACPWSSRTRRFCAVRQPPKPTPASGSSFATGVVNRGSDSNRRGRPDSPEASGRPWKFVQLTLW